MSIVTVFNIPSMNVEKYDRTIIELQAAGQGNPMGRLYHVAALQDNGSIIVTDVWESDELLEEFGKTLFPILENAGVENVEPEVYPVHNYIQG
jgi:hypothetical protein